MKRSEVTGVVNGSDGPMIIETHAAVGSGWGDAIYNGYGSEPHPSSQPIVYRLYSRRRSDTTCQFPASTTVTFGVSLLYSWDFPSRFASLLSSSQSAPSASVFPGFPPALSYRAHTSPGASRRAQLLLELMHHRVSP